MTTKIRASEFHITGKSRSSGFVSFTPYGYTLRCSSSITGYNHPNWRTGRGDAGGPMLLTRTCETVTPIYLSNNLIVGNAWNPGPTGWSNTAAPTVSDSEIIAAGTKSIGVASPNNPAFSLSTSIGELRSDGLPSIIGSGLLKEKTRYLQGSGDEYLNVQFGWLPMMSDLKKFAFAIKHHNAIIESFRRGSDSKIRRRLVADPVKSFRRMTGGGFLRPAQPSMACYCDTTEESLTQSWFSGAFRYHIPMGDGVIEQLSRSESYANKLLGVKLTPAVIWNLEPWTWMSDWFTNVGDIMTNISNLGSDGLAMQYGYQMIHKRIETNNSFFYGGRSGRYGFVREVKRRIPASPYGFAVTFDGLTNRQKAICAALGITRVR